MKRFGIKQGDCIEVMKSMKNDSVDFTLTDITIIQAFTVIVQVGTSYLLKI